LLAAGGAVAAVDAIMDGQVRNVFCAVRPPGHHAERALAMGFCYFNNVAIAAEHLRARYGLRRLAILDWDVHHGNGTQHIFEDDPDLLFCDIHQHPDTLYPGTGFEWEKGAGPGVGATLNIPLMPGSGDADYRWAFDNRIVPAIDAFKPEFLLISAGFDAHRDDPLADIELSTGMFAWMTMQALNLAERHCEGRLVSLLEGGYEPAVLAECIRAHLGALAGVEPDPD
jgi:acetoin utilization deacetylase AcuC-like enzyme